MTDIYTEYCLQNNIPGPVVFTEQERIMHTNEYKLHILWLKTIDLLAGIEREMEKMR